MNVAQQRYMYTVHVVSLIDAVIVFMSPVPWEDLNTQEREVSLYMQDKLQSVFDTNWKWESYGKQGSIFRQHVNAVILNYTKAMQWFT